MRRTRLQHDEQGVALVMALILMTIAAIVVAALMNFNQVDFHLTTSTQNQRNLLYAADGDIESAISYYRQNNACPASGTLPLLNNVSSVTVDCYTDFANAQPPANAPKVAVAALASAGESGLQAASGGITYIRGGVASNSTIDVSSGGLLKVKGPILAKLGCNPMPTGDPTKDIIFQLNGSLVPPWNCSYSPAPGTDLASDPNYPLPAAATTAPPVVAAPTTCPSGAPVVFTPGTYTDSNAMNAIFSGSCAGHTFLFPPNPAGGVGVYYFNFTDTGSHTWTISDVDTVAVAGTVAGGTTYGGIDNWAKADAGCTGAGCLPTGQKCDQNKDGAIFIFGGDSRVNVSKGTLEMCGQPSSTDQILSIYGSKTTSLGSSGTSTGTPTTGVPSSGTVTSSQSKTFTAGNFNFSPAIPAGAVITSLQLVVGHSESSNQVNVSPTVSSSTVPVPVATGGNFNSSPSTTKNLATSFPTAASLSGLAFQLADSTSKSGPFTVSLDSVQAQVAYTLGGSGYTAQSGCAVATTGSCDVVAANGPNGGLLSVHGTIYAPLGSVNIQLVGPTFPVIERGLVARHVLAQATPSSACSNLDPVPDNCFPFQLPFDKTTASDVVFVARAGGRTRLRAWVSFKAGVPPQVKSWSTVNEP